MRLVFAVLALGLASLPSARAQTADWQTFQPEGGGFQIDLPGKPNVKSEEKDGHRTDTALVAIDKATAGADLIEVIFLGPLDNELGKRFLDSFTVAKAGG
jgi:hypothetical protein